MGIKPENTCSFEKKVKQKKSPQFMFVLNSLFFSISLLTVEAMMQKSGNNDLWCLHY